MKAKLNLRKVNNDLDFFYLVPENFQLYFQYTDNSLGMSDPFCFYKNPDSYIQIYPHTWPV